MTQVKARIQEPNLGVPCARQWAVTQILEPTNCCFPGCALGGSWSWERAGTEARYSNILAAESALKAYVRR